MTPAFTLAPDQLDTYLARIGLADRPAANLDGLRAVHRAHAHAFTWEMLDAFMGWPSSLDPRAAHAKMVRGRRGGWCYEMNGLLGAALAALGYRVTRLCGGVRRADLGDAMVGNHLSLRVDLDTPWLADAGLGDALVEPIPLAVGEATQGHFRFAIEAADGPWLRFRNHPHGAATSFDFQPAHADEAMLEQAQAFLLQDPGSPFVNNLVIQRHAPGRVDGIINATRRTVTAAGLEQHPIAGLAEFRDLLADLHGLSVPDAAPIWDKVQRIGAKAFD
ncbi:arylamine N-acetyltransferase family protein [Zavarzinia sp. CC-PAN008]|uniref:arylamine N-acetyltransferase family protein n=1 Tax=Zavarzinia sp. CC-PAN008 TaxID=3243332 RepID=UPI003F748DC2